jgi:hypothetical protein
MCGSKNKLQENAVHACAKPHQSVGHLEKYSLSIGWSAVMETWQNFNYSMIISSEEHSCGSLFHSLLAVSFPDYLLSMSGINAFATRAMCLRAAASPPSHFFENFAAFYTE